MSLFAEYVAERLGDEIIENDKSFVTYRYLNDNKSVYIVDIYVKPEYRKSKIASHLADEVVRIAKGKGATELIGTVSPAANNATDSLKVLLGYGMHLDSANEQVIVFKKEI